MKTTMKKLSVVLVTFLLFAGSFTTKAQETDAEMECNLKYTQFRGVFTGGHYDKAYEPWLWTFENCPKLSINIYKNGLKMAKKKYKTSEGAEKEAAKELVERIYLQRFEYFPEEKPGKMYSEYGMFMDKAGASEEVVFGLLQKAYDIKPESLGVKALFKYFDGIILRNKDTNIQAIFDMNDNLVEVVNTKMDNFSKKLDVIRETEEAGEELNKRQAYLKKAYSTNLTGLGQVEGGLGAKLEIYATCDRLIPIYEADYPTNSSDPLWLKRAVSRLDNKGCTESAIYDKMVEQYVNLDPSSNAYVFYAGMLMKKGQETKALEYFKKAVDLEADDYKRANLLLKIAYMMKKKGRKGEARSYAYKAVKARPSLGKAYLLIAGMYASSAKSCSGGDVFTQRMVYQAALVKAQRARNIDPSISKLASTYIKNYAAKAPSTQDVFDKGIASGTPIKIGCWIGETVRVP